MAWNKYGSENFKFLLLEETLPEKDEMEEIEQLYIWLFRPEYNSREDVRQQNISFAGRQNLSHRMTMINKSMVGTKQSAKHLKNRTLSRMRLTENQFYEIIKLHKDGISRSDLSIKYNVSRQCIDRIVTNKIKAFQS